jgi:cell wall-associated NlpC family hydrolase
MALSGAAIAADALKYKGAGYVYGGTAASVGDWDCSSFVSYVLGHDLGLALPGGVWGGAGMPPNAHGPVVTDYASWASTVGVTSPQAGDLCCWVGTGTAGHIGIAISGTQMISALNGTLGTLVTAIVGTGPAGSPLVYRRLQGVPAVTTAAAAAANMNTATIISLLTVGGVLAAGFLVVVGGAVAAVWAVSRLARPPEGA